MANIKWTGIEQKKYGLTARWYVSAYYGNDTDVDGVGYYNPTTNTTGHGGPTRPFATLDKVAQNGSAIYILDSGYYSSTVNLLASTSIVCDGFCIIDNLSFDNTGNVFNAAVINSNLTGGTGPNLVDSTIFYSDCRSYLKWNNCTFVECIMSSSHYDTERINCNFIRCGGVLQNINGFRNNILIDCTDISFTLSTPRPPNYFIDYSIIIGTVKTSVAINGKTTGVTVEDFKADGNYFVKSYSEVDLFGNVSGSGASVAQINEIFNNYYSPIYIDDWQNADFTLRPDADDRVKFGGLNGTYIGAKPVGYRFSASDLWNTHIDAVNTSNLEYDMINEAIVLQDTFDVGTYRSIRISMPEPITVDLIAFMANFVYNIEGTAKQGVANQRIDTTVDLQPDNTANQRVVYDYRLQVAPNTVDALSVFKEYELNREPTIDASGNSQLDDLFDDATEQKQIVQDFIIEFTIRRVIID